MKTWLSVLLVGATSGVAGYFLGNLDLGGKTVEGREGSAVRPGERRGSLLAVNASDSAIRSDRTGSGTADAFDEGARPENLEDALRNALGKADPFERMSGIFGLLNRLDSGNIDAALRAFADIPVRPDSEMEYGLLLHAWGKFDPEAAIKFAEENFHDRSMPKDAGIRAVLSGWAAVEPQEALNYVNNLEEGEVTRRYLEGVLSGWMQSDPDSAADYVIENMEPGRERELLIGKLASQLMKQGMGMAVSWAERQEDPAFRGEAFEEITEDWVSLDPEAAAAWLSGHVGEDYSKEAVEDLARGWAFKDREAAASWLENLSEGEVKSSGVQEFVKVWAKKDPVGVAEWLNGLDDSGATDRGVSAYANQIYDQSPEAALDSAGSIGDEDLREATMRNLAMRWMGQNRDEAQAWADAHGYDLAELTPPVANAFHFQDGSGTLQIEGSAENGVTIDLGDGREQLQMKGNFDQIREAMERLGPEQARAAQEAIQRAMRSGFGGPSESGDR